MQNFLSVVISKIFKITKNNVQFLMKLYTTVRHNDDCFTFSFFLASKVENIEFNLNSIFNNSLSNLSEPSMELFN